MKNPRINESLIIGVDFSKRDDGCLLLAAKRMEKSQLSTLFQGKEAFYIYEKLISIKKGGGNDGAVKTGGAMSKMPVQK